jgi:hypothetical protein
MTRTNKLWAIGVLGLSVYGGVSVMFGHIPGANSGIGTFERIAALAAGQVQEHGAIFTGLGLMVIGLVLAALCLIGGEGSPDATTWDSGDCGDGGD